MIEKGIGPQRSKDIVTQVSHLWETWKKSRQQKEEIWDECIKHYMVYVDESKYTSWPWRCKVSRPITQEIVDSINAAIKAALFPDDEEFFIVKGLDDIGKAFSDQVQTYLKEVLFKMRYISSLEPFLKQLCIIGNSSAGIPWRQESVIRRRWQDGVVVPWKEITYDSTKIEPYDMFGIVFDPAETMYKQEVTSIRRKIVDVNKLKANDFYSNTKEIKGGKAPLEESDSHRDVRSSLYGVDRGVLDRDNEAELLILDGDIYVNGKQYTDYTVVVCNRKHLLRFERNPYWCGTPRIFANYSDFPHQLLGRGPAEPIRGVQKLIDTFSCQKADISNQIIGGMWAYKNDGVIDPEDLISQPFALVECEDVNNIKSLVPSANPTLGFAEIDDLRLEIERSSGASKFSQGVVSPGRRTATEALQIGAGSDSRFNDIVTHIGEQAIEPSLNIILQQEFQYNYGNPLLPMLAWEGSYQVKFHGARTTQVRALALQQFMQFTQIVGQSPVLSQFLDPAETIKEWRKLLHIKNENIIRKAPISQEFPELGPSQNNVGIPFLEQDLAGQTNV